jgi:SMODS and SLOG-associating 2TM effector domain 1
MTSGPMSAGPVGDDWQAQYVLAYKRYRLEEQRRWYGARARIFERARRQVITLSAVLLVFSACFGALAAADAARRAQWAFVAAALAAVGTALTSFEAAFGLERYSRLYDDAQKALALAASDAPRPGDGATRAGEAGEAGEGERVRGFTDYVERILDDEADTWSHHSRDREGDGSG